MDIKIIISAVLLFSLESLSQDVKKEVNPHDCKMMFTYGYGYNKFFHISPSGSHDGGNITIRFLVRARSDAHLLLSSTPTPMDGEAVYEVVLGGGKNVFSDIRRLRLGSTKATAYTKDLLSPVELRGFWVHFDGKGILQVGKEGDDFPFLFWADPSPLDIRYFSFSTWTGVVGKWLYDCPIANDSETIEIVEAKPTTMTEKLRKYLLSNYNPYALPVLHEDHRLAVFMHLTFHHVNLDMKRSAFSIDGTVPMHWIDEKIHWKPEDYGGLTSLHITEHEVWIPEIVLYNAVGHGANILGHAGMTVTSEGAVMWSPSAHLEVWCNLNLDQWPNDIHTCELQLGLWSQTQFVELLLAENETVMEDEQRTGSEWEVIKLESETVISRTPWNQDVDADMLTSGTLTIRVTVRRQSQQQNIIFVVPLIVINVLMMLSFWMTSMNTGKFSIQCMCLVLLAIFTVTVGNALPAPAEHVPCLVLMYSWSMIAGLMSVLVTTIVINISRYAHASPPPTFICALITLPVTQIMLFLPQVKTEASKTYNQLEENFNVHESCADINTRTPTSTHLEIQQYWIILSSAVDHISSFIQFVFLVGILIKYN